MIVDDVLRCGSGRWLPKRVVVIFPMVKGPKGMSGLDLKVEDFDDKPPAASVFQINVAPNQIISDEVAGRGRRAGSEGEILTPRKLEYIVTEKPATSSVAPVGVAGRAGPSPDTGMNNLVPGLSNGQRWWFWTLIGIAFVALLLGGVLWTYSRRKAA